MSEWIGKGTKKVIGFEESCKDDVYLTDHYPFVEPEVFISGKLLQEMGYPDIWSDGIVVKRGDEIIKYTQRIYYCVWVTHNGKKKFCREDDIPAGAVYNIDDYKPMIEYTTDVYNMKTHIKREFKSMFIRELAFDDYEVKDYITYENKEPTNWLGQ